MPDLFDFYKPLRNHLRKLNLIDSLRVIYAYVQHLQFGQPMPHDIEIMPFFTCATNRFDKNVFEWELDTLVLELLVNASYPDSSVASDTLRRWDCFAGINNKLRRFEHCVAELYPPGSMLVEIHRIAHRQFHWQRRPQATTRAVASCRG